ncbi:MAG: helix-turn-helix transcriptional regulator [Acidimicrobiia bacterium]|jgi:proteasome accessory factor B
MSASKLERLLNLTALLLDTPRPLTAEQIREQLEVYPEEQASFRRAFERDKAELRAMGIPIEVSALTDHMPAVEGYRIPRDEYALRDPGLEADELAALHLAASAVQVEGTSATAGLLKLGGLLGAGRDLGVHVAPLPSDPNLPRLFAAVASRTPVRFAYRDEVRTVDPYRLEFQRGRWYLTGFDHARDDERNFRLDRIEGEVSPTDGPRFDPPSTAVPGQARGAWELGAEPAVRARVRIDGPGARWAVQHLGPDAVVEEAPDSVVAELPVTNRSAFRSFVLSFLEHAEVLDPPELRAEVVGWLEAQA